MILLFSYILHNNLCILFRCVVLFLQQIVKWASTKMQSCKQTAKPVVKASGAILWVLQKKPRASTAVLANIHLLKALLLNRTAMDVHQAKLLVKRATPIQLSVSRAQKILSQKCQG